MKRRPAMFADQIPEHVERIVCIHCDQIYPASEVPKRKEGDFLWCKNYPSCDGAGYSIDLFDADTQMQNTVASVEKRRGLRV